MEQILVTIDTEGQSLQKIRAAIKMLRGVVSTSVMKDPVLTKTEKQQAYVKESLTRAMQEVRMAKLNGQKLPDARDLLKELDEEDWYGKSGGARILTLNLLIDTESMEVTLLTIYDKGEISNVTDEYIKYLLSNL